MKTRSEKLANIEKYIPDKNLRHIIFNYDDEDDNFLSDDKNCLLYFSNIMTFTTLVVWSSFLKWKMDVRGSDLDGNNSFWRIYNILDKICDPTKINGEIIDDFLINLEIDCLLDTDANKSFTELVGLTSFFNFSRRNNKLARYIHLVKQRRASSRIPASEFTFETFCEAIGMFVYLRDVKAAFSDMGTLRKRELPDLWKISLDCTELRGSSIEIIDFNKSLCVIPNFGTYYMEDFITYDARRFDDNGNKEQAIIINYIQFGGSDQFTIYLTDDPDYNGEYEYAVRGSTVIEDFFLQYDIINTYKNKIDNIFFRDYILLNNRYLKELSYTISDALSVDLKDKIIASYSPKYKEIFDKMYVASLYDKKEAIGYRWDEIVLFLLLEEGVYKFLRFLLQSGGAYDSFINSFQRRFGIEKIREILQEAELIDNPEGRLPPRSSEYARRDTQTKALVMLATRMLTPNEWVWEKSFYPTNIDDVISECYRVYKTSLYSDEEKIAYLANTILQVVRFVTKFYCGIFQYARKKKQSLLDLGKSERYYDGYKLYNRAKESWIEYMKTQLSGMENDDPSRAICGYFSSNRAETAEKVKYAFEQLIQMNNKYSSHRGNQNEILFDVLGRKYLFASDKMESYGKSIVETLLSANNSAFDRLYNIVERFLLYLKTGIDDDCGDSLKNNLIELAIYPIVGQYCSGVTSLDGYRYSMFRIPSFNKTDKMCDITIKMITDDEYDFGYSYYCIPNINRTANVRQEHSYDKIWVSPIIIPCSVYLPQSFSKLECLSDEKDYDAVIELIYESDVSIYSSLFGSLNNAKRILPALFNDPQSKFYKDHYRILRKNKEIIAIASIYDYLSTFWDYDIILKAFGEVGIEPPLTFDSAIKNIKNMFNEYIGRNFYHVDDVCVKEPYRHQGFGRSLMMYVLKMAEKLNKSIRLFVYGENKIAYNLYSSLGFVPIIKQSNFDMCKDYFQMVKI